MAEDTFFTQDIGGSPPPPAEPAGPTVDMNDAVEGVSEDLGRRIPEPPSLHKETFRAKEPEPKPTPEPEAAPPQTTGVPPATAQHIAALEQRAVQAEQHANAAQQQRGQFEQMLGAMDTREWERQQAHQMAEALQPPEIADPDALLTDAGANLDAMRQHADWGFRRAQAEYAPLINWASQVVAVQPAILQMNQDIAFERAAYLAQQEDGVSPEEFWGLRNDAYGVINNYTQNPSQQQATMLDPTAIKWAALMARSARGKPAPIQTEARTPPSPPSSTTTSARGPSARNSKPRFIAEVERKFNVKIPTDSVERYREQFGGRR